MESRAATADNRSVVSNDLPLLFERIRGCLDEPESDFVLKDLEHTLTDGYARALALEAERTRVEREIGELARGIDDPVRIGELRDLAERRTRADADLARLRALLELLRQRVAARRAVVVLSARDVNAALRAAPDVESREKRRDSTTPARFELRKPRPGCGSRSGAS